MDTSDLINAAMRATGTTSLGQLAAKADLSKAQLSKWSREELPLTMEGAFILAKLAGMRPERIAGLLVTPRTGSKVLHTLMREWARIAASIIVAIAATYTFQSTVAGTPYPTPNRATDPLYIM